MKKSIIFTGLLLLLIQLFSGCTPLRTEFYRNETKYLYDEGCVAYKQGEYEKAQSAFHDIIQLDPDYGAAYAALGNLAMIDEEYGKAYTYYTQAVVHDPGLQAEIVPFLMLSKMHEVREPLIQTGVDLSVIYPLLMEDKTNELQALFEKDVPVELLAKDTVSLTPGQLGELRQKAAEIAPQLPQTSSYRLFIAYLLFYGESHDQALLNLLQSIVHTSNTSMKKQAYLLLGRLAERMNDNNGAVDYYLAAVKNGLPLEEVAHYLARIYQVDIQSVLPKKNPTMDQEISKSTLTDLPVSSVVGNPAKVSQPIPDETEIVITHPQTILFSDQE